MAIEAVSDIVKDGVSAFSSGSGGAPLDSPAFTGVPTAPTPALGTNTTQIATAALVENAIVNLYSQVDSTFAKQASPVFTGTPTAPTATAGTNTTQIATTGFVQAAIIKGISIFRSGIPLANEITGGGISPYSLTFSAANSSAKSQVAATASSIFTIRKNGTQVGTITFSAAGTVGVISFSVTSVAANDVITVQAPASADATLADITILLRA